ncbi:MAG: short-chain dehydrogenase [Burkholderiales bacterium RIFCSPLOWO2_02_FULL_57_36]|nr:MAG: short-chain dehydrogenase [Burkholderiales bacterium RIFCSPLOWO2_02_FULL_57_36]
MNRLQGKTALITGGTTGIGFATAKLFLQEGARVAIIGQDEQRVRAAAEELGAGVVAIRADVASASDMEAAAARIKLEFGRLDIVFANAGIAKPAPFADADASNIDDQIDVNLKGVIYTVQKTLPLLNNPASIIFTSTTLAEQGANNLGIYSATKAAVRSLARTLSSELKERGVRVNVISPGLIETPIYGKLGMTPEAVQAWAGELLGKVPAGRFGQAHEIAKVALFLASDDSSYILGENLLVDGGMATI